MVYHRLKVMVDNVKSITYIKTADFDMVLSKRTKPSSVGRTSTGAFLIVQVEIFSVDVYKYQNVQPHPSPVQKKDFG
jgi:hypothetical protein